MTNSMNTVMNCVLLLRKMQKKVLSFSWEAWLLILYLVTFYLKKILTFALNKIFEKQNLRNFCPLIQESPVLVDTCASGNVLWIWLCLSVCPSIHLFAIQNLRIGPSVLAHNFRMKLDSRKLRKVTNLDFFF